MNAAPPAPARFNSARRKRFAAILSVLGEFCCYATIREIVAALDHRGIPARFSAIRRDLALLAGEGKVRQSGRQYCIAAETPQHSPIPAGQPAPAPKLDRRKARPRKASPEQIAEAIERCNGNRTEAARQLGISRSLISHYAPRRSRQPSPLPLLPAIEESRPAEPPRPAPSRPRPEYTPPPAGPEELAALWKLYKTDPTESRRNALAEYYLPLVKHQAEKLAKKLPDSVEFGDLISAGCIGLFDAIDAFDLDRGLRFETYAPIRIRGEMLDYLREMDWVPRLVRAKASRLARAKEELSRKLGREPDTAELAERLGESVSDTEALIEESRTYVVKSLNKQVDNYGSEYRQPTAGELLADARATAPHARLHDLDGLRKLTRGLNKRERIIIIGYYYLDETMRQIAEQLGVQESRVSQMHASIIERMRLQMAA